MSGAEARSVCIQQGPFRLDFYHRGSLFHYSKPRITGAGKWQTGIAALAFFDKSHQIQVCSLLQWQTSVAGEEDRANISVLAAQVSFIWQIGAGYYLRSTGIWPSTSRTPEIITSPLDWDWVR
jgi:hypothetical protein